MASEPTPSAHPGELRPAADPSAPTLSADPASSAAVASRVPTRSAAPIRDPDRYEILGEHGRGGLGRVSRAHDKDLGRDIAIKELLSRSHINDLRFAREAMITARLEHPGIVPVHEAGRWPDGTPFYAMKLVSGRPLRALISERRTVDERIGLLHHVIAVADAIAYAHERNIIHRDLKPANVIVGEFGETVVIDWGLAKDLSDPAELPRGGSVAQSIDDQLTSAGSVLGTPAYMAPEQEQGDPVDQRADVFALGAMLWELCSLQKVPPTDLGKRRRMLRAAGIDDDLATIIDKAIDRDRNQRYRDAGALAADLRAFKSGARITARSYSLAAGFAHWARRHRALATSIMAFVSLLVVSLAGLAVLYRSSSRNEEAAQQALVKSYVERGRRALLDGKSVEALAFLGEAYRRNAADPGVRFMLARAAQPRLQEHSLFVHPSAGIWSATSSPDGRHIVTTGSDGARVWDAETSKLLFALPHRVPVYRAYYGAGGKTIVTGARDGIIDVWDADSGAPIRTMTHRSVGGPPTYSRFAMSTNGELVAAADQFSRTVDIWDVNHGELRAELANGIGTRDDVMTFSADGRWLATTNGNAVSLFECVTWRPALVIAVPEVSNIVFDPTGDRLATVTGLGDAAVWSVPSGLRIHHLLDAAGLLAALAISPDGMLIATSGVDTGVICVFDMKTGGLVSRFESRSASLAFDRTSTLLIGTNGDHGIVVFDVHTGIPLSVLEGARHNNVDVKFDPSGTRVLAGSWDGVARLWDAAPPYRRWGSDPIGRDCGNGMSPDDRSIVVVSCLDHHTMVWNALRGELVASLPPPARLSGDFNTVRAIESPQGDLVAIPLGQDVGLFRLPDGARTATVHHPAAVSALAFGQSGHMLVSASIDGSILVTAEGEVSEALPSSTAGIDAVSLLADGRIVASDVTGRVRVYDRHTHGILATLQLPVRISAFRATDDGTRLIMLRRTIVTGPLLLWDFEHYRLIGSLGAEKDALFSAHFQHGDRDILTASNDGVARLWDAVTGELQQSYVSPRDYLVDATMSPDGAMVVTAGGVGLLRFFDARSGALLWSLRAHAGIISSVHFERNELVTRGFNGDMARWTLPPLPSRAVIASLLRCLPQRFDATTGVLVEQEACEREGGRASN